jgi:Icc-related predicted phosphoesterase
LSVLAERVSGVEMGRSLRVLHVSDIHCATDRLVRVLRGEEYDVVIASGDFECVDTAEALVNASSDVYAVTGNLDNPAVYRKLNSMGVLLDGRVAVFEELYIAGVGGLDFKGSLAKLQRELGELQARIAILVTHHPPKGVLDEPREGLHIGLGEVSNLVDRLRPRLHLFGHVHEKPGYVVRGETLHVNAGPLKKGYYALIETQSMTVKIKQLK